MTNPPHKGRCSTPDNPMGSKLMEWIRDHALPCQGDECLTWPFGRDTSGYGLIGRRGRTWKAHRYICHIVHGEPPTPTHHAAHSCGNGHLACVNPRHLSWRTPQENHKESKPHPKFVLTPEQVREIRKLKGIETADKTAARYGVVARTIQKIHTGKTWKTDERAKGGFAVTPFNKWAAHRTAHDETEGR